MKTEPEGNPQPQREQGLEEVPQANLERRLPKQVTAEESATYGRTHGIGGY